MPQQMRTDTQGEKLEQVKGLRSQGQGQGAKQGEQRGDSHAISLLSIPLPPPLASGLAVSLQSLLVNLLPLLLPAQVLRPLPARHGECHVTSTTQAGPAALPSSRQAVRALVYNSAHPTPSRFSRSHEKWTGQRIEAGLFPGHNLREAILDLFVKEHPSLSSIPSPSFLRFFLTTFGIT